MEIAGTNGSGDADCLAVFISLCLSFPLCKTLVQETQGSPSSPIGAVRLQFHQLKPELPFPCHDKMWVWPKLGWVGNALWPTRSPECHSKGTGRSTHEGREDRSSMGLVGFTQPRKSLAQRPARSAPSQGHLCCLPGSTALPE